MKISKLFSLAALALITTACSDQIEQVQQPRNTEGIPFTATISIDKSASTRALTENGTTIEASWVAGEKVALIHNGVNDEMTVASVSGGVATINGTITGTPSNGDAVTVIYPSTAADGTTGNVKADALVGQDGTLKGTAGTSISEKYDIRKSSGATLKVEDSKATLNGNVTLAQQVSIWKLTLQSGGSSLNAKALVVKDADDNLLASATLATAGSVFYMAVPAMTSAKIIAANGANSYSYSKASVSISAGKYYQSTVSLTQDEYTNLSATATANTYIISSAGKYKFNATIKGNGGLDPLTGTTASPISKSSIAGVKVLWELGDTYGKAIKYSSSAYDISYLDGYVYFSTPETFQSGNAYVAVYDNSDNILWSWLIWAGAEPSEVTSGTDKFMNRNLGSIAVGNYSRGFLYQWGRKDPFPAADGNNYTPYSYVPARLTSHSIVAAPITVAYAIANPTHFTSHSAWMTTDDYRADLWSDTEKTIYDPCPAGWRVPTRTQMNNFKTNVGLGTLPGTGFIGTCSAGGDFAYGNPGTGYYRSSTVINRDNSYSFCNDGRVDQSWPNYEGFAVRPVRDVPPATSKSLTSLTTDEIGWRIGSDGNAYSPGILPTGVTAVAMIAYLGNDNGEEAPYNHGLALAMSNANGGSSCKWSTSNSDAGHTYKPADSNFTSESGLQYNETHNSSTYPAFQYAIANNGTAAPTGCSTWFLPTGYQWKLMINACKNVLGSNNDHRDLRDGFSNVGGTNMPPYVHWSSTEKDNTTYAWRHGFGDSDGNWDGGTKNVGNYVRSALAF